MTTEIGPIQPINPVVPTRQAVAEDSVARTGPSVVSPPVAESDALRLAAKPPVDLDQVAMIRKAIANGSYPILPMRVADAIIAASVMLSTGASSSQPVSVSQ